MPQNSPQLPAYLQELIGDVLGHKGAIEVKLSIRDIKRMFILRREGKTNQQIADILGVTTQYIGQLFSFQKRPRDVMMVMDVLQDEHDK